MRNIFIVCFGVWARRAGDGTRLSRDKLASRAGPARTPKTPVFGLPKSRPSPLQKVHKKCISGAKSGHF